MTLRHLKTVTERALAIKYSIECGDVSLISIVHSLRHDDWRHDDCLSDHEIAARALAVVLIKES